MELREVVAVIAAGGPIRPNQGSFMVRCPAHDDDGPSLSISQGDSQPVLLHCFAGCEPAAILEAAGLTWEQISTPREEQPHRAVATLGKAVYPYHDASGTEVFQVVRKVDEHGKKTFLQRHEVDGNWVWNMQGVERVIYRLPEVMAAIAAGRRVFITEGEKDADAIRAAGECATTNPGGAGKWRPEYAAVFADAEVIICQDKDEPGRKHASQVRDSLRGVAAQVSKVEAKGMGKDPYDHLLAGHGLDDFVVVEPPEPRRKPKPGLDIDDYLAQQLPDQRFVFPHVLAESEVWMVTGFEGHGKSTLMKQLAVQAAIGVHPWTLEKFDPQPVLVIDTENATRDSIPDMAHLRFIASHHANWADRAPLIIEEPGPIDLFRPEWREWLVERVTAVQPSLIVAGPIYRMVGKELRDEDAARVVMESITAVQKVCNSAVILEHHVPKANGGERYLDPLGSGLLLRWCNFITGLRPITVANKETGNEVDTGFYALDHQRKGRRRTRQWPTHLRWGTGGVEWRWEAATEAECAMQIIESTRGAS